MEKCKIFKALGHEIRIKIIKLLETKSRTVTELCGLIEIAQPNVSQHVKVLRDSEIVDFKRKGTQKFYYLRNKKISLYLK